MRISLPRSFVRAMLATSSWLAIASCSFFVEVDKGKYVEARVGVVPGSGGQRSVEDLASAGGAGATNTGGTTLTSEPPQTETDGLGGEGGRAQPVASGGKFTESPVAASGGADGTGGGSDDAMGAGGSTASGGAGPSVLTLANHYYALDEASGKVARDQGMSDTLFDGIVSEESAWTPTALGGGYEVASDSDYLELPAEVVVPVSFSISWWINHVSDGQSVIFHKVGVSDQGGVFLLHNEGQLVLCHGGPGTAQRESSGVSLPPASEARWSHLVVTYKRNENGNFDRLRLWLDAELIVDKSEAFGVNTPENSTAPLRFGRMQSNEYPAYRGLIDEIRVYDLELTAEEVALLHAHDAPRVVRESHM